VEAKRLETFDGPTEFLPGLRSVALPGHTAGHTGYLVESEGQRLLIWGDVVHVAAVQFATRRSPSSSIAIAAKLRENAPSYSPTPPTVNILSPGHTCRFRAWATFANKATPMAGCR
jgi:glyoxylase-like metal-dependent hydrolase (beta-lactamase superfamily II)